MKVCLTPTFIIEPKFQHFTVNLTSYLRTPTRSVHLSLLAQLPHRLLIPNHHTFDTEHTFRADLHTALVGETK